MGPDEQQTHDASGIPGQSAADSYPESTFNALGMPLDPANEQQHSIFGRSTFAYPASNVIRFASKKGRSQQQPDSLENFDFNALPTSSNESRHLTTTATARQRTTTSVTDESSVNVPSVMQTSSHEPIPHSSGMTTVSNITSDDSATLIGQGRSNAQVQQQQQQQQQHLQQLTQVPQQQNPIKTPPPPPPIVTHITEFPSQPSGTILPERQTKLVRNYKLFPGRNKFFCGGRFMTSREYWAFILALVLLIAPSVLFGIFTCPFIWENVHPAIPIVFAYLFVLTLTSMIKTSWTDPGIIPRDLDPFPVLETYDDPGSPYSSMWNQGIPTQREVRIKDKTWTLRYCETCRIYRPPRASHCRQCDNCVEVEDHHCIWLNNCIGARNYRPFFVFINAATLMCLFVIVFSIVHLLLVFKEQSPNTTFTSVFNQAPVSFVLAIICFVLLTMVGGLTLYHCSLILRGITTHEQLRASVMTKHSDLSANPYNKGNPALNMAHVLCRPRPKSYLRRRKFSPAH